MRTREEILSLIDETVEYYNNNPRAVIASRCQYKLVIDGSEANCAVGRCLTEEAKDEIESKGINGSTVGDIIVDIDTVPLFKKEYEGFATIVWRRLQVLHDTHENWKIPYNAIHGSPLTEIGKRNLVALKEWENANFG